MKKSLFMIAAVAMSAISGASYAACAGTNTAQGPDIGTAAAPAQGANTCLCDGLNSRVNINGGSGAVVNLAGLNPQPFLKNGFVVQCSANSMVSISDLSATQFAVAGASIRGNQVHIGSSNGGSVTVPPTTGNGAASCTGGSAASRTCLPGDVTTALGVAETAALAVP